MFCNNYRERDQPLIKIEAVSAEVMKILIRYSYTSYLEITSDNVQNVLEAASLLQVGVLFRKSQFISENLKGV